MTATPVLLDPGNPGNRKAGALTYLGGVQLSGPDPAFGGFSAMAVSGDRFTLLSDGGNLVRFRMGADWQPRDLWFGDLPGGPGTGWNKSERDSESLALDPVSGRLWIAFESFNQIWRYDAALAVAERGVTPPAMVRWGDNSGAEAMVRLRDGGFIAIAERERPKRGRGRVALRFAGDPVEVPNRGFVFTYVPPEGYDPSDMTELPDGRLIVLNRRVTLADWFTAKLVLVDPDEVKRGTVVVGREIATLAAPFTRDNFEAIAATREGRETILWLATDDNRELFEKSLLMKFRLDLPD